MGDEQKGLLKIFLKVPFIIEDKSQIKNLHKDIEAIQLPRLKSVRFCILQFKDLDTKKRVARHLKTLKFNNKKLRVSRWRKGKSYKPKPQYRVLRVKPHKAVDERLSLLKKEEK